MSPSAGSSRGGPRGGRAGRRGRSRPSRKRSLTSHVFYQRDILAYWYPHMDAFRRAVAEGSLAALEPVGRLRRAAPRRRQLPARLPPDLARPRAAARPSSFKLMAIGHSLLAGSGGARSGATPRPGRDRGGRRRRPPTPSRARSCRRSSLFHHFAGAAWLPWVLLALEGLAPAARASAAGAAAGAGGGRPARWPARATCALWPRSSGPHGWLAHLVRRRPTGPGSPACRRAPGSSRAALALALGAAQWLPTAERAWSASGPRWTAEPARTGRCTPPRSPTSLVPRLVSDLPLAEPARRRSSRAVSPSSRCLYLGVVPLALAALGLALRSRLRGRPGRGGPAFLVAASAGTPPSTVSSSGPPSLGLMRYPQKFLVPAALCVAVLAAVGPERLGTRWTAAERRRARLVGALLLAAAVRRSSPRGGRGCRADRLAPYRTRRRAGLARARTSPG